MVYYSKITTFPKFLHDEVGGKTSLKQYILTISVNLQSYTREHTVA